MIPLLIGHNGILGSRIRSIIDCETINFKFPSVEFIDLIKKKSYSTIINCAVDKTGDPVVNIELPNFLSKHSDKLIHFCTDAVFSGFKTLGQQYTKNDIVCPTNQYGVTKSMGSEYLLNNTNATVIRTSFLDIRSEFVQKLSCDKEFCGYSNYYWNGLTAKQVAIETKKLLENNSTGLYHLFGNITYTKYEIANIIINFLNWPTKVISVELNKGINRSLKSDFLDLNFDINQLQ
jgi:dTDP-4-dehydrorhamnose reductase